MIEVVIPVLRRKVKDTTGNCVLYYSPEAQKKLHNQYPNMYRAIPPWNFSAITEVMISGTGGDDFKFYRYK